MSQFKTITVRQIKGFFGDYGDELEQALNEWTTAGWSLVTITTSPIKYVTNPRRDKGQLHTIVFKK